MGRLVAAKFWSDWAQQMRDGLLNPNSVIAVLESNEADIKALAMAKLALGKAVGWDRSKGTTALFLLARGHLDITERQWLVRQRRYVAGLLESLARRIRGR